ncbi:hypothetical protein ASD56_09415 [Microbacterium sp. Root166]|uniref:hypothetical protein n=1 Tax=Microbacterium sp. Root166 TaxID=1736478 RepID=UPI0006FD905F|nr:hypothetical protein [Microbacterium sp. Root166]KQZ84212.1 hypothetical protein ASD56_09415 [Microbacterium sp. Root166]
MTADEDLLTDPYRALRPVSATADGPWPGMLVSLASGERRIHVAAADLPEDWWGWQGEPDGHLLVPLDVVRRDDGHDVAIPLCTERLADFLARRDAAGAALVDGEAVTVAVSVLRGCVELSGSDVTGEWWLTEAGRPVLATDAVDRPATEGALEVLDRLGGSSRATGVWAELSSLVAAPRLSRVEAERLESELFGLAAPLPLQTATAGSRTARDLAVTARDATALAPTEHRSLWGALTRHLDGDLADMLSQVTTSLWRRGRATEGSRRMPWLIGGAAAVIVLAVGLLWPTGEEAPATADAGASATPAGSAAPTPAPSTVSVGPQPDAGAPTDLVQVTTELLDERRACGGDAGCLGRVMADPSTPMPSGAIDLPPDQRAVVLLDDFGGVTVLRVDPVAAAEQPQLVVIVRLNDEWLLRDVQDVAQQP